MKKVLKTILVLILVIILMGVLFLGYLTLTEYKPLDVEQINLATMEPSAMLKQDDTVSIVSWNTGYSALGKERDFVMDGGGKAPVAGKDDVHAYHEGIENTLDSINADIRMLQEVDLNSKRTFHEDQSGDYSLGNSAFALNYSCGFVPFPWPPFGKIKSGIQTTTSYAIDEAYRYSLPCPFTWPLRTANLKRCMMPTYIPVEGSDQKLVIVNFHLEAYDSGEGKIAQTNMLLDFVQEEYKKGNWVIAGGDWNQGFPESAVVYPNNHEDLWAVGSLEDMDLQEGWSLAYDNSTPSCRLLNQPYDPSDLENTQYYVIDGFLISPNVKVKSIETLDEGFENTDHNPVLLNVKLK